jgi:hypothetical protein
VATVDGTSGGSPLVGRVAERGMRYVRRARNCPTTGGVSPINSVPRTLASDRVRPGEERKDVIELGEWAKIRRLHRAEGVNDGHTATLTGMVGPCPRCAKWSMLHGRPRASTGFVDHPVVGAMSAQV